MENCLTCGGNCLTCGGSGSGCWHACGTCGGTGRGPVVDETVPVWALPGTIPGLLGEVGIPVCVLEGQYAGYCGVITDLTTGDVGPVVALTGGPHLPLPCDVLLLDLNKYEGRRRALRWLRDVYWQPWAEWRPKPVLPTRLRGTVWRSDDTPTADLLRDVCLHTAQEMRP